MAYHGQSQLPYDSNSYYQQPYQDHYQAPGQTQQGYSDPYNGYSQHQVQYSDRQADHYPPAPADYGQQQGYYDNGRPEYGGGYESSQSVNEKVPTGSYPSLGRGSSEQTVSKPERKPEAVFANANPNAGARQSRGSVAAQMAAEGAIPEKAGLRMWRSDEHAGAFTRGGKGRACFRCCCCTVIVAVLLIVCTIAAFLLWVRPPNITFNGIEQPSGGNEVNLINNGFMINFRLNIGVTNPNFFGANFESITATAFYPTNKTTPLGGGSMNNVQIKKHSNTTIHFPFAVNYTTALDPNRLVLTDLATKCGFIGNDAGQIVVDYTLTLVLKVLAIKINPSFSSTAKFDCPLSAQDIASAIGASASSLESILGSITSGGGGGGINLPTRSLLGIEAPQMVERRSLPLRRGGYTDLVRRLARRPAEEA